MQNYLQHLIADMRRAARNLPVKPYYDIPPEAEGIAYVIEWENAEAKPMQEWFGIAKENFPPAEKLTDDQITLMVDELLRLWEAYRFYPNLPKNLPLHLHHCAFVSTERDVNHLSLPEAKRYSATRVFSPSRFRTVFRVAGTEYPIRRISKIRFGS